MLHRNKNTLTYITVLRPAFPWAKAAGLASTNFSGDSSHLAEIPLLGISLFGEVNRHSGFYELRSFAL